MSSTLQPVAPSLDAANSAVPTWKHAVLLIAAAWCLYGGTMGYPFLFDDQPNIRDNEEIRSWEGIMGMLASDGRPLAMLTFAANYAVSKYHVWSYHLVNLLVHCAAGLTLYGLIRRTLLLSENVGRP